MKVPVALMRGGTSKAVFFNYDHMPSDHSQWEAFLLDIMGSPDQRQIDGLGGGNSLTSKAAIIRKSTSPHIDVEYTFGQVSLTNQTVDFKGNCGNISSAVGPYAIEQGLVQAVEPITTVRIFNTNTKKLITADVEVKDGHVKTDGRFSIPGVPGTGSPIYLSFTKSEGAVTGKLFPTGNPKDTIKVKDKILQISIVDVANPLVFIRAADIGLTGTELPHEYTPEQLDLFESIRSIAAELCGFSPKEKATVKTPAVPKLTLIAPPMNYTDVTGVNREAKNMNLVIRMMSMQKPHQALAITGAICSTASAFLEDTIVSDLVKVNNAIFRLGHPAGIMETKVDIEAGHIQSIKVARTARKIFEGYVYTKHNYEISYNLA
ncbi:2-methylaconitate cis-trans isomerase PrpF family protein [Priestia endophytica]|uniref:2-methylaconitate cis-trans isomerase PrpF family protein n=1 Tax=Priestia endophytica TaxID=135735 RepID=UPI00228279AD|nr:PrpF domain-containing protein [Priestia endophytica]MCY8230938.1 3-methylitaconate isomerase [Priestia endophytica]